MGSRPYILSADITRVLATIAVVAIHVATPFVDYPPYFHGPSWWIANLIDSASRVAVPLFVMLSGYLLLDPQRPSNLRRRLVRIGIPFIVWNAIYIVWNIYFWFKMYTFSTLVSSLIEPAVYHHLYFLNIILGLYLTIPLLQKFITKTAPKKQYFLLSIFYTVLIAITLNNYFNPAFKIEFHAFTLFIPYIAYFLAGYYLRYIKLNTKQSVLGIIVYGLLVLITTLGNYYYMKMIGWSNQFNTTADYGRYFYDYFSPNVVIMSLLSFILLNNIHLPKKFTYNKKVIKSTQYLAASSFGIYLLHPIVLDLVDRYIPVFNIANIAHIIAIILLVKILTIVVLTFLAVVVWERVNSRLHLHK